MKESINKKKKKGKQLNDHYVDKMNENRRYSTSLQSEIKLGN